MTPVIVEQIIKYGRRPLLHIIVMYATNKAVRAYAFGVSETFMASGIDVHVQTTLRSDGLGGNVETRHMSELIATSHADFVVMVGDRNMKHNTVHRERKETLAEVRVADMQGHIWKNWPQNPLKNYERIRDIAHADLDPFVLQYTNKKLDSHRAEAFKQCGATYAVSSASVADMMSFQGLATRFHRQVVGAYNAIANLVPASDDFEHTRGGRMPARYRPNACYTPKNTIAPFLKYRLCAFLVTIMGDIEQALDVPHAHMWRVYIEKHRALWSPLGLDEPPMPVAGEEPAVLPLYGRQHERVAPATYEKVFPSLTRFMPLPPVEEPPVPEVNAVSPGFLAIAAIWNDPAVIARRPPYYSYF